MGFKNAKQRAAFFALQKKLKDEGKIPSDKPMEMKIPDPIKEIENKFKKIKQSLKIKKV